MVEGPCDWGVVVDECAAYDALTSEKQADVIAMATEYLWNWTGRVFGVCEVAVRPCRGNCTGSGTFFGSTWSNGKMLPTLIGGSWYNIGCGDCRSDECSCPSMSSISLPGPVLSITEIRIDGEVMPPTDYQVQNERYLVRLDGNRWPVCQNMAMDPMTDPATFLITYKRGIPVPAGGRSAATLLACEFAKAIVAPSSCALPQRMKNITRDGVTVTLMDDMKDLEGGKTGIWAIDAWVDSVTKPQLPSSVRSVDIPRPKFRTTTGGA